MSVSNQKWLDATNLKWGKECLYIEKNKYFDQYFKKETRIFIQYSKAGY
jgi:hypothetical protein